MKSGTGSPSVSLSATEVSGAELLHVYIHLWRHYSSANQKTSASGVMSWALCHWPLPTSVNEMFISLSLDFINDRTPVHILYSVTYSKPDRYSYNLRQIFPSSSSYFINNNTPTGYVYCRPDCVPFIIENTRELNTRHVFLPGYPSRYSLLSTAWTIYLYFLIIITIFH